MGEPDAPAPQEHSDIGTRQSAGLSTVGLAAQQAFRALGYWAIASFVVCLLTIPLDILTGAWSVVIPSIAQAALVVYKFRQLCRLPAAFSDSRWKKVCKSARHWTIPVLLWWVVAIFHTLHVQASAGEGLTAFERRLSEVMIALALPAFLSAMIVLWREMQLFRMVGNAAADERLPGRIKVLRNWVVFFLISVAGFLVAGWSYATTGAPMETSHTVLSVMGFGGAWLSLVGAVIQYYRITSAASDALRVIGCDGGALPGRLLDAEAPALSPEPRGTIPSEGEKPTDKDEYVYFGGLSEAQRLASYALQDMIAEATGTRVDKPGLHPYLKAIRQVDERTLAELAEWTISPEELLKRANDN